MAAPTAKSAVAGNVLDYTGMAIRCSQIQNDSGTVITGAQASAIVTLTDSSGYTGTHNDTMAAVTVPAAATGGDAPTETEYNDLRSAVLVMVQNDSDMAAKIIELRQAMIDAGILAS